MSFLFKIRVKQLSVEEEHQKALRDYEKQNAIDKNWVFSVLIDHIRNVFIGYLTIKFLFLLKKKVF